MVSDELKKEKPPVIFLIFMATSAEPRKELKLGSLQSIKIEKLEGKRMSCESPCISMKFHHQDRDLANVKDSNFECARNSGFNSRSHIDVGFTLAISEKSQLEILLEWKKDLPYCSTNLHQANDI